MSHSVSEEKNLRRAVFLDRDGTLNEEKDYLIHREDLVLFPGVAGALRRLRDAGFLIVVVTNQSGVARGYFSEAEVEQLHAHLQQVLAVDGARIDAFYHCPHHPDHGHAAYRRECDCRKGAPGMLLQAAREHGIDLAQSFMIGDKRSDIEAGARAGCRSLLVLTGYGRDEAARVSPETPVVADLPAAVQWILAAQ